MALTASPLPTAPTESNAHALAATDKLDEDIVFVRTQIAELTQRRSLLTSSLLSSTHIQNALNSSSTSNLPPEAAEDSLTSIHRLAFGVTTFPFTDPSPSFPHGRLLGIRFDTVSRTGAFNPPNYVFLRRTGGGNNEQCVHRHTIPSFVPIRQIEQKHLPVQGVEDAAEKDGGKETQDLHGFVGKVRQELVSWNLRREAIEVLAESLNLKLKGAEAEADELGGARTWTATNGNTGGKYGVSSIGDVAVEARFAKIVWADSRVGRIKISDKGTMERVVVIGEGGREKMTEQTLLGENVRIEDFATRLEMLAQGHA